jgi:hypothetical protein
MDDGTERAGGPGGARGSGGFSPLAAPGVPCRFIRVVRSQAGFAVVIEIHLADHQPVSWTTRSFVVGHSRSEREAEREANRAALQVGARIPAWFDGEVYVVVSDGAVTRVSGEAG